MIGTFQSLIGKTSRQFAFGIAGLAFITFTARLLHLQPGAISLLYLIVIVFVSLNGALASALAVSLVALSACIPTFFPCSHRQERRTRWEEGAT
jgi:hypothetical protein